jgi:uncharacterized membrane protein
VDGYISYPAATGLDENNLWEARQFTGSELLGYKVALCERDVAIYAGILLFGLAFAVARRRIKSLHWVAWLILGIVPIGVDGLSQLISQLPIINTFAFRESTPFLRTLTGGLFGFITAWFGYPLVEESMRDTRLYLDSKLKRIRGQSGVPPVPVQQESGREKPG